MMNTLHLGKCGLLLGLDPVCSQRVGCETNVFASDCPMIKLQIDPGALLEPGWSPPPPRWAGDLGRGGPER